MITDDEFRKDLLAVLKEIRDTQRQSLEHLEKQTKLIEDRAQTSIKSVEESISLQKLALNRAKSIGFVAVPAIVLCIIAILYLVLKYF